MPEHLSNADPEAGRTSGRLIPQVLEMPAATPAGALAKTRVVLALFGNSGGRRSAAVRSQVADLAVVLDVGAGHGVVKQ